MQLLSRKQPLSTAFRLTLIAFRRDNASRFGAALAFYGLFTIAPMVLLTIAIAGIAFGRENAEREILARIAASFGPATAVAIATMIKDAVRPAGWLPAMIALATLYFGVTGVYRQIDDALRTIWRETRQDDLRDTRSFEKKLASMFLVMATAIVILISVVADAAIVVTGRYAESRLVGGKALWHGIELLASMLVLTPLFAGIFRFLPRARVTCAMWASAQPSHPFSS